MNETESKTDNFSITSRFNLDYSFFKQLKFSGLASYSFTNNKSDNYKGKDTYAAFVDRLYFDTQGIVRGRILRYRNPIPTIQVTVCAVN